MLINVTVHYLLNALYTDVLGRAPLNTTTLYIDMHDRPRIHDSEETVYGITNN